MSSWAVDGVGRGERGTMNHPSISDQTQSKWLLFSPSVLSDFALLCVWRNSGQSPPTTKFAL